MRERGESIGTKDRSGVRVERYRQQNYPGAGMERGGKKGTRIAKLEERGGTVYRANVCIGAD